MSSVRVPGKKDPVRITKEGFTEAALVMDLENKVSLKQWENIPDKEIR